MEALPAKPSEAEHRPIWMSKFGPSDYKRFDDKTASQVRVAQKKLRAVEIECRFAFRKSRWGTIGERKLPAGILYMDIDFRQPSDCRLQSATVSVTLDEDVNEENEDDYAPESDRRTPVKFTDCYGPKGFRGQESSVFTKKTKNITPYFEVLGYGAGGVGKDTEKVTRMTSRWKFSGHISSTKNGAWYNDKLEWVLEENSLEAETSRSNTIHTAFAFEHNAKKVYIDVHIQGKLAQRSQRIKEKLRSPPKWKFGGKKDQGITTKIQWNEKYSSWASLDTAAEKLAEDMYFENLLEIPIEIPDTLPAEVHPGIRPHLASTKSSSTLDTTSTTLNENGSQQQAQNEPSKSGGTEADEAESKPMPIFLTKCEKPIHHFASPTLENINQIVDLISNPEMRPSKHHQHQHHISSSSSDNASSTGTTLVEETKDEPKTSKQEKDSITGTYFDPAMLLAVLQWVLSLKMISIVVLEVKSYMMYREAYYRDMTALSLKSEEEVEYAVKKEMGGGRDDKKVGGDDKKVGGDDNTYLGGVAVKKEVGYEDEKRREEDGKEYLGELLQTSKRDVAW
ncbi:hypothetical protein QBC38DRAFT_468574 [Podospora fimiseda]|uniref:Uncharacterized protein n=1 Tax=Podospora fimiseda TaxID=252190 RepID=A0AAN7BW30_9PEZI|nr:hypothetical protein QBC38DRAFT_468574 [Podospora fimiseda]